MASAFDMTDISLHYSEKRLLEHVSLTVTEGDRIGVVGRNGAGKSTLLRLLAGTEEPDGGTIQRRRGQVAAYLPQTPDLPDDMSIRDAAVSYLPAGSGEDPAAAAYEAETILTRLGFRDLNRKCRELSGGQRMRVALAGVLCRPCDALLLDEPTNHIDLEMTNWLEDRLQAFKGTLIVVTHDRWMLERCFDRIFHVGLGRVDTYQTDYAGYLEEQAQREEMQAATLRKERSLYRRELQWIRRGAQARSTKAKGRIQRFEALSEAIAEAPPEAAVQMKSAASRLGRKIIAWNDLAVGIGGKTLIEGFSYTLLRDDRLGIVGPSGAGKTTLLRTLAEQLPPVSGTIDRGGTVKIGFFAQHCPPLDADVRVIDAVQDVAVRIETADGVMSASQMAETFLFPPAMQYQRVGSLSGGEQRRLYLLRVLMTAPNVLLLDEPTNDLDLETLNVLEDYLDSFRGAVIAVSHDRYFLDRVTRHLFAVDSGRAVPWNGTTAEWLAEKEARGAEPTAAAPGTARPAKAKVRPVNTAERFSFKEQRDFDHIEETVAELEDRLSELEHELASCVSDYMKVSALMQEQTDTRLKLDEAMERWLFLQEKKERIDAQGK